MKAHEYKIHRNARGSYSILFEDGSVSVSFLPSRREAETHLAWMVKQDLASAQAVRP
jgi:hypothetical protein